MKLTLLPDHLTICRRPVDSKLPAWLSRCPFFSVTRTHEELSLVVPEDFAPDSWQTEGGWRAFMVEGPLDFAEVGILADLTQALASAGVSVFSLSTFDTDYLLVKASSVVRAVAALEGGGHDVE